jgi:predicted dehydrogenase/dTDP-4-amino-4,6-dideoxygalactose transaminase
MKTQRHAIVGCGRIAVCHADAFAELRMLAACTDPIGERAAALAARYGMAVSESFDALLEDATITSLSLCTPHDLHGEMAMRAVERGKHVLVEKPLVLDLPYGEQLIAASSRRGAVLMPVVQHRFDPIVRAVTELVHSNLLGGIRMLRAHLECARPGTYYRDSDWRGRWAREGGSVTMNQAYHIVDLMMDLCGEVERVSAEMSTFNPQIMETEDTLIASLRFRAGTIGALTVIGAGGSPWNSYIELIGADGEIAFTINYPQTLARFRLNDKRAMQQWKNRFAKAVQTDLSPPAGTEYYGVSHRAQARAFAAKIDGEATPVAATAEQAIATVALVQRIYDSARRPDANPQRRHAAKPAAPPLGSWDDTWVDVTEADAEKAADLVRSGQTSVVSGGVLEAFERRFARFAGADHAVSFSNGTGAIYTALRAVGVGAGDEVLVCDYSFHAVAAAIFALGARLVACDCLPDSMTLDPLEIERKRTGRSRAVVVHCPWGTPPLADRIRAAASGLAVVYDASHAHGATYTGLPLAHFADATCYSLGRQKLVSGGELGCAVTSDLALRNRMLTYAHVNRVPAALRASNWNGNAVGLKFRPHPVALSLALSQLGRAEEKLKLSRQCCGKIETIFAEHGFVAQSVPDGAVRSYWRIVFHLDPRWDGTPVAQIEQSLRSARIPVEPNPYWPLLQEQDVCRWPEHAPFVIATETPVAHAVVPRTITLAAPVALHEDAFAALRDGLERAVSRSAVSA